MKKTHLGLIAVAMVALLGFGLVSAYKGDYSVKGPNYSEDRHIAMQNAFDNLDYEAWVELMTADGRNPRVVEVVTEDNFVTFVEAHEAGISGDYEKAAELRAELGLGNGQGSKRGMSSGQGMRGSGQCPRI